MAEPNWFQHAIHIGVFEFRRSVRAIWQDKARAFLMGAGLVFSSLILVGFIYLFSGVIRNVGTVSLPPIARGTVALLWLFGVFIATQRVVSARPRIDAEPLMLTTVSARTVVGGLLLGETLRVLAYLGLPVVVLTGGVVYLFSSLVSLLLIPLAAVLLGLTAVIVGMVIGYAISLVIVTVPFVARHKTVLGGLAVLVAMGGYALLYLPPFWGFGQEALAVLPIGWFIDVAVIGSPIRGSMTRAVVVVVGSVIVVAGGVRLVEREATRLWFIDTVSVEETAKKEPRQTTPGGIRQRSALADAIAPLVIPQKITQPTRRVAQWSILRTMRDPRRLNFLLLPVVMVGSGLISPGIQSRSPWVIIASATAVLLPWMMGALFAMNPFGDEGAVLPVTLISVSGSAYIRGLMLPGLLIGIPVVVLVAVSAALKASDNVSVVFGLVGIGLFTVAVSVTTATAVGLWFPRFSAIRVGQSREVIPPRLLTTALHFFAVTIPGTMLTLLFINPELAQSLIAGIFGFLPAVIIEFATGGGNGVISGVGTIFHDIGTAIQSTSIGSFRITTGGLLVIGGVLVAVSSYQLAIRRFNSFDPPA